ncbi:MAG: hypothetical protein QOD14_394 [Solirubrobacterales bacterium]|jgi:hypothetical protein|nr:hypothetical protein [Solirubrobacterales bacterium]
MPDEITADQEKLSDRLEGWLEGDQPKTLGNLIELFGEKSFAILFVLLMAVPALPLPTGGVTHVFEVIVMLLALELIVGRRLIWLPERFRRRELGPVAKKRFTDALLRRIRWLERHSRPRLGFLLSHRLSSVLFGVVVLILTVGAFVAPPFTGLDTLPSLGVVMISLGFLLEDSVLALAGLVIGIAGLVLVVALGTAVAKGVGSLF